MLRKACHFTSSLRRSTQEPAALLSSPRCTFRSCSLCTHRQKRQLPTLRCSSPRSSAMDSIARRAVMSTVPAGRLVDAAALHAHEAALHDVHAPDAVVAAQLRERSMNGTHWLRSKAPRKISQPRQGQLLRVYRKLVKYQDAPGTA